MMRRMLSVCAGILAIVGVVGGVVWRHDAATLPGGIVASASRPEGGKTADGRYTNDYFGLSYRLPPGWNHHAQREAQPLHNSLHRPSVGVFVGRMSSCGA